MEIPSVVVITGPELAPAFRTWLAGDPTVVIFLASQSLRALEEMSWHPPKMVVLDPAFVTTARGAALVAQVKADACLGAIDLRVLAQDGTRLPVVLDQQIASAEAALLTASLPLDHCGTRQAARFPMKGSVGVTVNGERSQLVNLSVTGVQLLVPTRLRPEQSLRLALLDGSAETRLRGVVAWSAAEPSGASVRYRAGVKFIDPDTQILEAFCARNGVPADRRFADA